LEEIIEFKIRRPHGEENKKTTRDSVCGKDITKALRKLSTDNT